VNCHYNFFSGPDDVIQKPIDLPRVITSHQRKFVLTFFFTNTSARKLSAFERVWSTL